MMQSNKMSVAKGVAAGMIGGMILGIGAKCVFDDSKRTMKKKAKKVADAMESMTDSVKMLFH